MSRPIDPRVVQVALDRVARGESVTAVAGDMEISVVSLYKYKQQRSPTRSPNAWAGTAVLTKLPATLRDTAEEKRTAGAIMRMTRRPPPKSRPDSDEIRDLRGQVEDLHNRLDNSKSEIVRLRRRVLDVAGCALTVCPRCLRTADEAALAGPNGAQRDAATGSLVSP